MKRISGKFLCEICELREKGGERKEVESNGLD